MTLREAIAGGGIGGIPEHLIERWGAPFRLECCEAREDGEIKHWSVFTEEQKEPCQCCESGKMAGEIVKVGEGEPKFACNRCWISLVREHSAAWKEVMRKAEENRRYLQEHFGIGHY